MQKDYAYLRQQYPAVISCEQLSKICHISKRKAKWLLENGVVPCIDTGKKTWRFQISIDAVLDYLLKRYANSLPVAAPPGIFSSKPHKKTAAPVDLAALREYTQRLWRNEPDVLTVEEASRISGFSKDTIYHWIHKERLMSVRYMGRHIIPKEELIKAMFG